MELGLRETKEVGDVVSPEGNQTVIASYWRVSSSHIKKSSKDVREWKVTQDLMFCPSAVVVGSFRKTSMTCSHTGGREGGSGGVIKVGMLEGGLAGGVEASGGGGGAKGRVRGHEATGVCVCACVCVFSVCGHDGGWELVVEARTGSRFQKIVF